MVPITKREKTSPSTDTLLKDNLPVANAALGIKKKVGRPLAKQPGDENVK
jgi:hypothetical protein